MVVEGVHRSADGKEGRKEARIVWDGSCARLTAFRFDETGRGKMSR